MSDKPIAVGDLAMQVGVCCGRSHAMQDLGKVAIINMVGIRETGCPMCGQVNQGLHASAKKNGIGAPVEWLKRIDPPARPSRIHRTQTGDNGMNNFMFDSAAATKDRLLGRKPEQRLHWLTYGVVLVMFCAAITAPMWAR